MAIDVAPVLLNALVVLHLFRRVHQSPHKVSSVEGFCLLCMLKTEKNNLPLADYVPTIYKCKCDIWKSLLSPPPPGGFDDHTHCHLGFTLITTMIGWNLLSH